LAVKDGNWEISKLGGMGSHVIKVKVEVEELGPFGQISTFGEAITAASRPGNPGNP